MTATLHTHHGQATLRFERQIRHRQERVWQAITDPDELREWFPAAVIYEPRVGAPMQFDFGGAAGQDVWPGEVVAWDPPRAFAFRWGEDELRFELAPADEGTLLVFTHSFTHQPGKPARDAAGWEACFEAFDALLDAAPRRPGDFDWAGHHERYLTEFGELTVEDDGERRRVRLTGPYQDLDGHRAVNVQLDSDGTAVLVVRDEGAPLADGAPVEVRAGSVDAPGETVARGRLRDPLATA
ncbi:MAG: SRPBCC family protein [Solirubrobacteraceae bacterium]